MFNKKDISHKILCVILALSSINFCLADYEKDTLLAKLLNQNQYNCVANFIKCTDDVCSMFPLL